MKTYRIYGLVLAVFCCMTLVIAAAGAAMAPAQGTDQAQGGPPHGYTRDHAPGNMSMHQGNFTSPPHMPENWTGNWTWPGNMSIHQANFTSPPHMPENWTGNWTWPGNMSMHQGNFTSPPHMPENWTGNWTGRYR
jgi:hypothetical protein